MNYNLQDILSPGCTDIRALEADLIEARLAYEDSYGDVLLCPGTIMILEKDPDYLKRFIKQKQQDNELQPISAPCYKHKEVEREEPSHRIDEKPDDEPTTFTQQTILPRELFLCNQHAPHTTVINIVNNYITNNNNNNLTNMAGDRVFNFNGSGVTFNDIHDNNNCNIYTGQGENPEANENDCLEPVTADDTPFHWPWYTSKTTDEEKKLFEENLRRICTSQRKCISLDVKAFLKTNVANGLINRPDYCMQEWEILYNFFDYPYKLKTYYNT